MLVVRARAVFRTWLATGQRQRRAMLATLVGLSLGTATVSLLWAQEPQPEPANDIQLTNQEEAIPELPETTVTSDPFPATPLPSNEAITPTRTPTVIGRTGTALTVITAEEIAEREQPEVSEILRGRVGLDVVRSGGPGGQTSVFLRGANSQGTKVLLDGIPINDPSNATRGFDFATLDVENIERIEILRGPQSLLYGSDAIGGVINIITKRGSGPATARVSGMGGSFGTSRAAANVSGGDDFKYYSLGGSFYNTNGISQASVDNGNTEPDGLRNGTLSGRFGLTPTETMNVDYVFRYNDSNAKIDNFDFGSGMPIDNLIRRNLGNSFVNRVQVQSLFLDGAVEQIVGFSLTDYHREDTDPEFGVPPEFNGQSRVVDWQMNLLLTETNTLTAGAQYYAEDAMSSFNPEVSQFTKGVFLQDQWQLRENWYASVGVRWDDNSRAGPAETYRFTSIYTVEPIDTDIHGSIGTGFRAPALAENLFAFGNPNLRPERSKGWDIGATKRLFDDRLSIDATYYRNDFEDQIVFDLNTFTLENIGQSRATGVELTSNWQVVPNTQLYANYTLTNTKDLETDRPLLRRPRDKATVGIDQFFWERQLRVGAYMLYVGDRLDTRDFVLDEYTVVNVNGSYYFSPRVELFARMDNVFNENYQEIRGYGVPGVAGFAGMNFVW